jgi:hypothetical protein
MFSNSHGPAQMLSLDPRFANACSNPLTMRIPRDGDQRSEVMAIGIPK